VNQDVVFPGIEVKGHFGFWSGLASNMYFDPISQNGLVFAINGDLLAYPYSTTSSYPLCEQQIQLLAYNFLFKSENLLFDQF